MNFLQLLKDYNWLISLVVAIVAIVVAVKLRSVKRLDYQLLSCSRLINISESTMNPKIKIIYEDKEVANPVLIEIKFRNLGNLAIDENDFRKVLEVNLSDKTKILTAETKIPNSKYKIPLLIAEDESKIKIDKFTLNEKGVFILMVMADLKEEITEDDISVDGYIAGVRDIKKVSQDFIAPSTFIGFVELVIKMAAKNIVTRF